MSQGNATATNQLEIIDQLTTLGTKLDDINSGVTKDPIELTGQWLTGHDGSAEVELVAVGGLTPNDPYYFLRFAMEGTDDGGSGAASVTPHVFSEAGQTPGRSKNTLVKGQSTAIEAGGYQDSYVPLGPAANLVLPTEEQVVEAATALVSPARS